MWPLDRTAPGPDALYSSRHFLAESELKSENSLWKDSTIFLHTIFRLVSFMWLQNARISSWRQVGVFCFDGFHSFMAPQITLLFLEFLYGFLCPPIVLISGIENVEYMVFLTDKNILFIV